MGAWGYGVYENDYALDFLARLDVMTMPAFLEEALMYDEYSARLGAKILCDNYTMLSRLGGEFDVDKLITYYIDRLRGLLKSDWTDSWNDPGKMQDYLLDEINDLCNFERTYLT